MTIEVKIPRDERRGIRHAVGFMPGTHFVNFEHEGRTCERFLAFQPAR